MTALVPFPAPGLPADWLNAWLAAIGVTVLVPEIKLSWSEDVVPHAVFWHSPEINPPEEVLGALPTVDQLAASAIATTHRDSSYEFKRNVPLKTYRDRARIERASRGYLLAASVSDLLQDADEANLPHAAFDPTAPRGETLYSRSVRCREALTAATALTVHDTLLGRAKRVSTNGLGFDARRLTAGVQPGKVSVDPLVELLVLASLPLFPFRGGPSRVLQRGFTDRPSRRGCFEWWTWFQPLDKWAIDAVLDGRRSAAEPAWRLVPYSVPPPDNTRAYFSERVR